jgi:hypothetical protein
MHIERDRERFNPASHKIFTSRMCIACEQAMMTKPDNANDPQQGGEVA